MTDPGAGKQLVFVGGLHRSGTTPLTRWIAQHPQISAFRDTGAFEDEGQHLQDVYPTAAAHGGPGRFAFDPRAQLDESSPLVGRESAERLWRAWSAHWDLSKPVLVEKSPPNLVRTRFLQALFPQACFVIVTRHPVAVAYATRKWSRTSLHSLLRHWAVAHERFAADADRLERLIVVRYEDLVADPSRELARVFSLLRVDPYEAHPDVRRCLNDDYLERWSRARTRPLTGAHLRRLERRYEDRAGRFGYSFSAAV